LERAASEAVAAFLQGGSILNLQITQIGRLRLFRLRDEILQRDRVRDDSGVLWAKRHFLPDLSVKLQMRDTKQPFSVVRIDVDHLRDLNTELGHPGADAVLKAAFEVLRDAAHPHDAYRLGGDEAGAILPGVSRKAAKTLGEQVCLAVADYDWSKVGLAVRTRPTVSIGVGTHEGEAAIEAAVMDAAVDGFAYKAKEEGRNRVIDGLVGDA
jgi:diguanylate cyclase (GGDEF)-like protein